MKTKLTAALFLVAVFLGAMVSLRAQSSSDPSGAILSPDDLDQLVAPIALYPDPLIALILPASTVPTDIVVADRYVKNGGDPNAIDQQSWDPSVKGLARYPEVLAMMDENLDWTNQLGAAVLAQQADVMTAIQAQRAKAQQLGNLASTPQQQVSSDDGAIQIVPADPQVIYVPTYDPTVVYVQPAPAIPFITFGAGFAMGIWIGGDCDWHNHRFYNNGYYRPGYGWGRNNVTINNNYIWRPNPNKPRPRPPYRPNRPGNGNGHLPGWRPPNGGNRPNRPNNPNVPGNRPGNGTRPGNNRPEIQPVPGNGGNKPRPNNPGETRPNRPANPGKPSTRPGADRPSIQPVKPGAERPSTRPGQVHTQPAKPEAKPQVQPRPQPKPAPKPAARPAERTHQDFDRARPSTKPRPSAQPRPAARPAAQPRPAARPAAPARGGGGGNRGGGNGQQQKK